MKHTARQSRHAGLQIDRFCVSDAHVRASTLRFGSRIARFSPQRAGILAQCFVLCVCLVLAGCGFKPLYGSSAPGKALMHTVSVDAPSSRTGYVLSDALAERFGGAATTPAYRLQVEPSITRTGLGVSTSNIAARFELSVVVNYTLTRASDGAVVTRGVERAATGYDVPENAPYASVAAQTDAETRAARIAAEQIWRAIVTALPATP